MLIAWIDIRGFHGAITQTWDAEPRNMAALAIGDSVAVRRSCPSRVRSKAGPQADASGAQLEEILVTAQRRESKLQDTPIAVSVIDGGEIQRENLISLNDIAAKVPSITFNQVNHFRIVHFNSRDDHRQ